MNTKALRQKILDLAIRGKLVPQDPNDEPAEVLLERIRRQKQQMLKEGKLKKKDIKNDTIIFKGEDNLHYEKFQDGTVKCIEDEIPFEVPEGWAWTRLANVISLSSGKAIKVRQLANDGAYPVYGGNGITGTFSEYNVEPDTIVIGRVGFYCGSVHKTISRAWVTDNALICKIKQPCFCLSDFLVMILTYLKLGNTSVSTAQPVVSGKGILPLLMPVPPVIEQTKIKDSYLQILPLVDTIEKEKVSCLELIQTTKSKILDLAIRGKLVPQDPNDEPASVLLERVRTEKEELIKQGKIKRDKKESFIFKGDDNSYYEKIGGTTENIDDKIPFDLPQGWIWCHGYSCFEGMESTKPQGEFFDYIDIDAINNRNHCIKEAKRLPVAKAPSRANRAVRNGSVLFSLVRPYLENIAFVDENYCNCIASTGFYVCNSNGLLLPEFMYYLMISGYVVNGLNQFMKGDNSPSISKDNIEKWLYPVPPIREQKNICNKLKVTFSAIEHIEESLS